MRFADARGYHRVVSQDEDGFWLAQVLEFPGCMTDAETPEEALRKLNDAADSWLEACHENNIPVPLPYADVWRLHGGF